MRGDEIWEPLKASLVWTAVAATLTVLSGVLAGVGQPPVAGLADRRPGLACTDAGTPVRSPAWPWFWAIGLARGLRFARDDHHGRNAADVALFASFTLAVSQIVSPRVS